MKTYIGTKMVNAKPMTRQEYNSFRGWKVPDDENPLDDGYLVEYHDGGTANTAAYTGYVSWSPKEQFENAYRETSGLTFGLAIEAVKKGARITRAGWNGQGMFVYYVPANSYPATTEVAKKFFWRGRSRTIPRLFSVENSRWFSCHMVAKWQRRAGRRLDDYLTKEHENEIIEIIYHFIRSVFTSEIRHRW